MKYLKFAFRVGRGWVVLLAGVGLAGTFCASAAVVNVSIVDYSFVPASVTINDNDSVIWHWASPGPYGGTQHSSTSDTMGLWDSGVHSGPFTFAHQFTSPGNYAYHCVIHAAIGMTGQVTVKKLVMAVDCGTPINPLGATGQIEGGMAQALGTRGVRVYRIGAGVPLAACLREPVVA